MLLVHRGASGAGLYSSLPLTRLPHQTRLLLPHARAALTMPDGRRLRVVGVHPYPPLSDHVGRWAAALESLPGAGRGTPWVLAGDFNGTFDQAEFRDVVDRGYRDAGEVTGKGLEPTWPTMGHRCCRPDHDRPRARRPPPRHRRLRVDDLPGSDHRASRPAAPPELAADAARRSRCRFDAAALP